MDKLSDYGMSSEGGSDSENRYWWIDTQSDRRID